MSFLNSKKLKELQSENEDLKKRIDGLSEKENHLKRYDELVKKARIEYAEIATKKDQTAQKLEALDRDKTKLINELNKISLEIKQLREIKLIEHNQVRSLSNALGNLNQSAEDKNDNSSKSKLLLSKEIEVTEKRKNDIALETFNLKKNFEEVNNKINNSKKVLQNLNTEIEKKKEEISSLIERQKSVSIVQSKNFNMTFEEQDAEEIQIRIARLSSQEEEITEKINNRRNQLDELNQQIEEKKLLASKIAGRNDPLDKLSQAESSKKELLLELEIKIEAQEALLSSITEELKAKTELHNELQLDNEQIVEELETGKEKLAELNESIAVETIRLTDLDYSLTILEDEFDKLNEDISEKMTIKEEVEEQISEKIIQKVDLEDVLKEIRETTSILAQLKNDIEKGTGQSAKRFTGVIQYYSSMINDMSKKKANLEKVLTQKEKEFREKQSALQQTENVLFVRLERVKLFEDLTHLIADQRMILENSGFSSEDIKHTGQQVVNNENSQKKLLEYENALKELLSNTDKYSGNLISTKSSLDKEIVDNKNRLNALNQNIRHSTSELSELRNSIDKIKIEHEDHRVSINKLASIKTRFEEEIKKKKLIIDKYASIKDKIRQEQELIKKKREITESIKPSTKISGGEKTFGPHNPKWIKL